LTQKISDSENIVSRANELTRKITQETDKRVVQQDAARILEKSAVALKLGKILDTFTVLSKKMNDRDLNMRTFSSETKRLLKTVHSQVVEVNNEITTFEQEEIESLSELLDGDPVKNMNLSMEDLQTLIMSTVNETLNEFRKSLMTDRMKKPIENVPNVYAASRKLVRSVEILEKDIQIPMTALVDSNVEPFLKKIDDLKDAKKVWDENIEEHENAVRDQNPAFLKFDKAAASEDGANIKLLTPTVREYLEAEELLNDYVIKR
jgi:hypothetical protein